MDMLEVKTKLFASVPEGDLVYCNGKQGSELASLIREKLSACGYLCEDVIQEDYGWGFHLQQNSIKIWIAAGLMDEQPADAPHWGVCVSHEIPILNPLVWFKKREGKDLADKILSEIKNIVQKEPAMTLMD